MKNIIFLFSLTQLLLMFSLASGADTLMMSAKKEAKLGKEMYDEIITKMSIYQEPKLVSYVNKVGNNVAKVSDRPNYTFTFTIIDSPDINAFATPGGYIYINRGLIAFMTSEAQLAAVLAHEIGHVTAEHSAKQKRASNTNRFIAGLLGVLTGSGEVANASAGWGQSMVSGYGRDMELEADQLGAQFLYRAGYDPKAMIEVITILKDNERFERRKNKDSGKKKQNYHGLFATHPKNDKRLKEVIHEAGELSQQSQQIHNISQFRVATEGLIWGEGTSPQQRPKNRFYQERFKFSFDHPEGWIFSEKGSLIVGHDPEQKLKLTIQRLPRYKLSESPLDYIKLRLKIPLLKKSEPFSQSRLKGQRGFLPAVNNAPDARFALLFYSRYAYRFHGEFIPGSDKQQRQLNDATLMGIISSFRPLSNRESHTKSNKIIHYVQARKGLTFAKAAKLLRMGKYGEEQLRLLNGYDSFHEPKAGEWIKIIK